MKKKIVVLMIGATVFLTACGETKEKQPEVTTVVETMTTEKGTIAEAESSEKMETNASKGTSLEEYLKDYKDSATYHLLYDYALNKKAEEKDGEVSYHFELDENENRIPGTVIAHYSKVHGDTTYAMSFCRSFIQMEYPELSEAYKDVVILEGQGEYAQEMEFDDYSIRLIPSSDLTEMTVELRTRHH
ncbi:MAG: hypothetical protein K6G85_07295 [Eubacterium sp.]|nr:hypothetical protein [Eubacterium sp.]